MAKETPQLQEGKLKQATQNQNTSDFASAPGNIIRIADQSSTLTAICKAISKVQRTSRLDQRDQRSNRLKTLLADYCRSQEDRK